MRKLLVLVCLLNLGFAYAQEEPQTEDTYGVKLGLIGAWGFYEKAIGNDFTLNSEIGYIGGFLRGTDAKLDYVFTSVINLEPRYYYNLKSRHNKGKDIAKNAANYLGVELYYVPDLLSSSNRAGIDVSKAFGLIPKYGFKRNLSELINFEFAFGIGYSWGEHNINGTVVGLDLRLGFNL